MDLDMPLMNGYETTKKIFAYYNDLQYKKEDMPAIVACTAFVSEDEKQKCINEGMVGFINKPINRTILE